MTDTPPVKIEIEDENEVEPTPEVVEPEPDTKADAPAVTKKKVSALSEIERAQLIQEAKAGKESEFYSVHFLKDGKVRITERKQTKAQQLIQANNENPERVALPSTRYLTDNQLLFEHIINLESSFQALKSKHKKLKRRYNELEGYLYGNDDDDEAPKPSPQSSPPSQQKPPEVQPEELPQQPSPNVQRRYVRSWRQIGNQ